MPSISGDGLIAGTPYRAGETGAQATVQSERIWRYLRSHWLANSVFRSLADIMDACEMAWNWFATNTGLVRSLCAVAWAPASPDP